MKTHQLFCYLLIFITCCIFALKAESIMGEVMGYIAVIISTAVFSNNMLGKLVRRSN